MRIGLDADGVISPYDQNFAHYMITRHGWDPAACTPPTIWEFYLEWGLTFEEYWEHHINGINAGVMFTWSPPYPKAVRAIKEMKARGHEIHIVTDRNAGRPGVAMESTAVWFHQHGIPYHGIYFGGLKDVCSGLDVFVDDRPKNVDLMLSAGVDSWLLDRPYNQEADNKRVKDLCEFLTAIEERDAA